MKTINLEEKIKSNLKLRQLGCNNEYKKTLSFITERVKVQMNYL